MNAPQLTTSIDPADEQVLRRIVQDVEDGFNHNDASLLTEHMAEDAVVGNAVGVFLEGRAAIDESNRRGLAGPLADATAHYEVSGVALLAPDVAVAQKRAWSTPADATAGKPPEMVAQYVFARRDGRWWIARRQNTLVP